MLVSAGVVAWSVWGTAWNSAQRNSQGIEDFQVTCRANSAHPAGDVIAVLSIPALGLETPVVTGVGADPLSRGVGWYPNTARPGQAGNFAVAGYRITHGSPLRHVLELKAGDTITVRDCTHSYQYTVETPASALTVRSDAGWVLDAVPGHPEQLPTQAIMTITANQDLVPSHERAVLFARLGSG